MSEVWINDVDLADYGFVIGANPNHQATPSFSDPTMALLGVLGQAWSGEPTQAQSRRVTISGHVLAGSSAAKLAAIEAIKQLCAQGAVRIRFADRPDRELRDGRLTDFIAPPRRAIFSSLDADISIAFDCADPQLYDVNPQGIPLSTARASLPMGTGVSFPQLVVSGGGSTLNNPTFTYRNAAGDPIGTMGFTVNLGVNDYLAIDCARPMVTLSTAGVKTDGTALWTSGDFLAFRGADGWIELGQFPTLELSGGVGLATFAKAWL
jgi:hypothetical protein